MIGAGPTGLACGIELKRRGVDSILIDKGCVVNSLYNYPTHMTFFTTPELLEIGDIPMTSLNEKPDAHRGAQVLPPGGRALQARHPAVRRRGVVRGRGRSFHGPRPSEGALIRAKKIVIASGYYDVPNLLNVPGEDLPKVIHYYKEAHPYYNHDVLVVGAKNSAAIVALELYWTGARVTLVHRARAIHRHVKYWIKPNIENRIKNGEIQAFFHSPVAEINHGFGSSEHSRWARFSAK